MKVPLLDLGPQHRTLRQEILRAVEEVLDSQHFILGPVVERFEAACAAYCQVPHALGVSSGTDALLLALMALGVGPGDEVITSAFSFFATAGSVARLGARPVFVDIDPETFLWDLDQVEARIGPRTRVLLPVHLFGQCVDLDRLEGLARRHGLALVEDAAQALGAEWQGRRAGSVGEVGCFSFFPSKNLGGAGDGGLVTTGHPDLADRMARLRNHGARPKYFHDLVGGNFRLDALQAAILAVKLPHLDRWTARRQQNAAFYQESLQDLEHEGLLRLPAVRAGGRHIFNQYTIRVPEGRRDALRRHLAEREVGTEVYYPCPLHLQRCFADLGYREGDLPEAEKASREVLSIPVHPDLAPDQRDHVVASIRSFFRS